jgi:RNA polymerase sigma-70 factor (ECF subfamily)
MNAARGASRVTDTGQTGIGEGQDALYARCVAEHGAAVERLARGYEADGDARRDLVQDIHLALWRSFRLFDGRCSLRTWTYRVAHNVGATHVGRDRRRARGHVGIDELADAPDTDNPEQTAAERHVMARLTALIHQLKPADRQLMLLYLEDLEAAAMAEITGLSVNAVSVKIHRIKALLAQRFRGGAA